MKVILLMVSSIDGKTTKWGNPNVKLWTSTEDQTHFKNLISKAKVIIMGRKTYDVAKNLMEHNSKRLRIVLTKSPAKYSKETIRNQLEFTSDSAKNILTSLQNKGFSEVLLVGGTEVNSEFLSKNLVTNLWLTIEPKLFGLGNFLVSAKKLDISLKLENFQKMNSTGTLLLKYQIINK